VKVKRKDNNKAKKKRGEDGSPEAWEPVCWKPQKEQFWLVSNLPWWWERSATRAVKNDNATRRERRAENFLKFLIVGTLLGKAGRIVNELKMKEKLLV
jgi:hypothetical protein